MNIPVLLFKRLRLMALGVLLVPTLTACPFMMPFMIPMHSGGLHGGERSADKPAQDLAEEGVTTLAANHGPYRTIAIGEVSVRDVPMSGTKFRDLMVRTLRSRGEWKLVESESDARQVRGSDVWPPEDALGLLDGQLYQEGDRLYLALQLVDYSSGGLFWSGLYSRPSASQGSHSAH